VCRCYANRKREAICRCIFYERNIDPDAREAPLFPENTRDSTVMSLMVAPLAASLESSDYLSDNTFGVLVLGIPFP